jgi:hypothetical protein
MAKYYSMRTAGWFFAIALFLVSNMAWSQETKDVNARSPNPGAMSRQEKKAQKTKVKQKEKLEMAIVKGRKRHEKIQSREVRKRMKKSKHRASLNNAHKREFFLKRWFTPKQKRKSR